MRERMTHEDYALVADVLKNTDLPGNLRGLLALNLAHAFRKLDNNFRPVRWCLSTMPTSAERNDAAERRIEIVANAIDVQEKAAEVLRKS